MLPMRSISVALLVVLGVAGCGGPDKESPNPYAAEFKQALADSTSDFERGVLADGKITDAEYAEAQSRLVSCVADHGYVLEILKGPVYRLSGTDGSGFGDMDELDKGSAIQDECALGTTWEIESLYIATTTNPENEDLDTFIAACLVQHGLVPEGFTKDDLSEFRDSPDRAHDRDNPQVEACLMNPKGL